MAVRSSTLTCTVGHFWFKQTTNHWRWSAWRILLQPQLYYRGCFSNCNSMTCPLCTDQARKCSWLMPSAAFLHRLIHRSSLTSELMLYLSQPSQGATWWRLQQKHNETQSFQQYTDWHWMVGPTDTQTSPESPETTEILEMNSQWMMTYSWKVNKSSSHHPAEMLSWTISTKAMQESTRHWPWLERVSTGQGWKLIWQDHIKRCQTCIESSNLPIETPHPHEVPPGTWVKLGMDFFQDHHRKKYLIVADYFSKFPYIFPVASAHHFKTINHLHELFTAKGIPAIVMSDNGPPFNGEEFKRFAREFNFMHTTSSPYFHQSNGFIEAMVKKVKNAYRKTDGSPNAQARALLQLWDTRISTDLPSPAEILHGCPAQEAVLSRPSKWINIHQIWQRLVEVQNTQKEQFNRAHRAKDLWVLRVNEQVQFFPNKQQTGPPTWLTGTVTKILDSGRSYMIQGPNGRAHRRNRAHLKPICYDGMSFQDHPVKKEGKKPEINSFQDPKPTKVKNMSFQMDTSYVDGRSMFFLKQSHIRHPLHHHHLSGYTHPGHHHIHLLHLDHPENHQWSPAQRTLHLQAGRYISLTQPSSDPRTLTEDSHLGFQHYYRKCHP